MTMRRYLGCFVYEIKEQDVGQPLFGMWGLGIGRIRQQDVGKQVYRVKSIYQIETEEQRDKRLEGVLWHIR